MLSKTPKDFVRCIMKDSLLFANSLIATRFSFRGGTGLKIGAKIENRY